ncbi:MAG: vWA domain-containing protein, partial [Myxococcota bacterium]|nr:vWA domain-containing protein [Myxococcota bacterium]
MLLCSPASAAATAEQGAEIVVIYDNSGSMQGADPERLAVLGALIIHTLGRNPADEVTVIGFGNHAADTPPTSRTHPDIRDWPYAGTYFRKPLQQARGIFDSSDRPSKMLIFFTDGEPEDMSTPADMRAEFDPDAYPGVEVLAIGLFAGGAGGGERMLRAITHDDSDFRAVDSAGEIITAFTEGYARAVGSEARTGSLSPGAEVQIGVGRYVSELTVVVASERPGDPFDARLSGPDGEVERLGEGDNGCNSSSSFLGNLLGAHSSICAPPRRHYQVFRATNGANRAGDWLLSLPQGTGDVDYGVIMRFGLGAEVQVAGEAAAGVPLDIEATLTSAGQAVDDGEFLAADGFQAWAEADGQRIPLTHAGGGRFTGQWIPGATGEDRDVDIRVVLGNDWMTREVGASVAVRAAPLELRAPAALDFGRIRAGTPTLADDHCQVLDLSGSQGLDKYTVRLELVGLDDDCEVEPRRVTGTGAERRPESISVPTTELAARETLCLAVPACAGEVAPDTAALRITPLADGFADQQADVALVWEVEGRNWLVCNAWWLALIGTGLVAAWGIYGFVRPARFQRGTAITLAGDLRGLRRSGARTLVEIRGSSIGFYRDARLGLFADGEVHGRVRGALCRLRARRSEGLVIEGGPVEMQDRRTRKWAVPDDLAR